MSAASFSAQDFLEGILYDLVIDVTSGKAKKPQIAETLRSLAN